MEAPGELVQDALPLLGLPAEHQGLEEAPGQMARVRAAPSPQAHRPRPKAGPSHPPSPETQAVPEGMVQALATKLEEAKVLLSHGPAKVVAVERSGAESGLGGWDGGPQGLHTSRSLKGGSRGREGKGQPGSGLLGGRDT